MLSDAALGAIIGAAATLGTQGVASIFSWRTARNEQRQQLKAAAMIVQDDFLHYQAVIMRSLDHNLWWRPSELLPTQATSDDRRRLWVALEHEQEILAAQAQGWMDVLIAQRATLPAHDQAGQAPALKGQAPEIMCRTFCDLEQSRKNLAKLARRDYMPFEQVRGLVRLERPDAKPDELGIDCCQQPRDR